MIHEINDTWYMLFLDFLIFFVPVLNALRCMMKLNFLNRITYYMYSKIYLN